MDNYDLKSGSQKTAYLMYELVGTFFVVLVFNITGVGGGAGYGGFIWALFVSTFLCWDVGAAQFNLGILVASLFYNFKEFKESYKPFLWTAIAQCGGTFLGYLLTQWLIFEKFWQSGQDKGVTNHKYIFNQAGMPSTMCPLYSIYSQSSGTTVTRCNVQGMHLKVIINEFICCFLFYFCWLIVRYYAVDRSSKTSWASFYKPLLCTFFYMGAQSIGAPFFSGFKNPNLAFQLWMWNKEYYGYKIFPNQDNQFTVYDNANLGRYAFIYFAAPFGAAIFAGFAAKFHISKLEKAAKA